LDAARASGLKLITTIWSGPLREVLTISTKAGTTSIPLLSSVRHEVPGGMASKSCLSVGHTWPAHRDPFQTPTSIFWISARVESLMTSFFFSPLVRKVSRSWQMTTWPSLVR
jgi:hypothetical protein